MRSSLLAVPFAVALAFFALPGSEARAVVISTFDTDADGWIAFQNTGATVTHTLTGGNPGGHISVSDVSTEWAYLQAPSKFLGPAAYGGTLSFDLRGDFAEPVSSPGLYNVRVGLQGNGYTLISELTFPTTNWTNYSFTLTETAGWRSFTNLSQNYSAAAPQITQTVMKGILSNLTRLVIATDYTNACSVCNAGGRDTTYLDNVRIDTATPVPVPAALPLLGSVMALFAGLGGWRRLRASRAG